MSWHRHRRPVFNYRPKGLDLRTAMSFAEIRSSFPGPDWRGFGGKTERTVVVLALTEAGLKVLSNYNGQTVQYSSRSGWPFGNKSRGNSTSEQCILWTLRTAVLGKPAKESEHSAWKDSWVFKGLAGSDDPEWNDLINGVQFFCLQVPFAEGELCCGGLTVTKLKAVIKWGQ